MTGPEIDILAAKIAERITTPARWMKLSQAVIYSSIGKERLIDLAKAQKIDGFQDLDLKSKPWIFDRDSIDSYRADQFSKNIRHEAEEFALDFMEKLRIS